MQTEKTKDNIVKIVIFIMIVLTINDIIYSKMFVSTEISDLNSLIS